MHFLSAARGGGITTAGRGNGAAAVRLPGRVHPWQLHNLAVWLLEVPGVGNLLIAESAAGAMSHRYWPVPDAKVAEWLCGWDEGGTGTATAWRAYQHRKRVGLGNSGSGRSRRHSKPLGLGGFR